MLSVDAVQLLHYRDHAVVGWRLGERAAGLNCARADFDLLHGPRLVEITFLGDSLQHKILYNDVNVIKQRDHVQENSGFIVG